MPAPKWIVPVSLRGYQRSWLGPDILAGVILAAVAIPEVMGYTSISQTPIVTGLYTILFPLAAFALLGSSKLLVVGGDSATAAILYAGIAGLGVAGLQPGSNSPGPPLVEAGAFRRCGTRFGSVRGMSGWSGVNSGEGNPQ